MEFERPTFLINPDICKSNIRVMAEKASASGVIFRPHFKTHQSLVVGQWFREAGITRITTSSLSSAAYFAADGWDDITVAFPVNLREIGLINQLASRINLGLLLEDPDVATELIKMLKFPVDAYIKIDTGYHRTGLTHEEMPIIKEVVNVLDSSPLTRFKGFLTHAGHTYHERTRAGIKQIYSSSTEILNRVKEELDTPDRMVLRSYGDTPSSSIIEIFDGIDEIRPGNFVFYDLMQLNAGVCLPSQVAGIVVCPVVAVHPARNQVVFYGGAVHLSKESIPVDGRPVYGQLVEMDENGWYDPIPDAVVVSLSQEHGILHSPDFVIKSIRPGMVIGIIPVHSCLTASLMQGYELLGGGKADYFFGN